MCELGGLSSSSSLDVLELGAPDHQFLFGHRQRLPRRHVVHVLLHVHIAAAREVGILVADLAGADSQWAVGVFGAVDEAEQVAVLEEAKAMCFVDDGDRIERLDDSPRKLETHVHRLCADVEQQIARRRRGVVAPSVELDERMQFDGSGSGEQPVPRIGSDRRHHRQPLGRVAKAHRAHQTGDIAERVVHV